MSQPALVSRWTSTRHVPPYTRKSLDRNQSCLSLQILNHHPLHCRRSPVLHEREGDEEAEGAQNESGHLHAGHEPGGRLLGLVWQEVVPPHWAYLHVVRISSVLHHRNPSFSLSCFLNAERGLTGLSWQEVVSPHWSNLHVVRRSSFLLFLSRQALLFLIFLSQS